MGRDRVAVAMAGGRMIDEIRDVESQARELYEHPFRANAACHEARLAASLIRSELGVQQTQSLDEAILKTALWNGWEPKSPETGMCLHARMWPP